MSRKAGFHVTAETKNKLRKANTGASNPFYGKCHSKETIITIGEKSKQWHAAHPDFRRGVNNPNFGKRGPASPSFGLKRSDETRRKQSLLKLGRYSGPGHPMWGKKATAEHRKNLSLSHIGKKLSKESEAKRQAVFRSPAHRAKQRAITKALWNDPAYRYKTFKAISMLPSNTEKAFHKIAGDCVEYVGDGKLWFLLPNGKQKNPDFRVIGTNKVIEVHGDYWHRGQNPDDLINLYKQIGLDCLVVWGHEIDREPETVQRRFNAFVHPEVDRRLQELRAE